MISVYSSFSGLRVDCKDEIHDSRLIKEEILEVRKDFILNSLYPLLPFVRKEF